MLRWFHLSSLFFEVVLLSCLAEASLSNVTLPFQFLYPDAASHRSGNLRAIFDDPSLSLTKEGRCRRCGRSCRSYGTHAVDGRSFQGCISTFSVCFARGCFSCPLMYRPDAEMGWKLPYSDIYGELPFNGSLPTEGMLLMRVMATYDDGKAVLKRTSGSSLNESLNITLPLSAHHYGQRIAINISRSGLHLQLGLRFSVDCSLGYYPADACGRYTGCAVAAPCVRQCSATGQASCESDCFADVGPCVENASSTKCPLPTVFRAVSQHSPKASGEIKFHVDDIVLDLSHGGCTACTRACTSYDKKKGECSMTLHVCLTDSRDSISSGMVDASTCANEIITVPFKSKFHSGRGRIVRGRLPFTGALPTKSITLYVKVVEGSTSRAEEILGKNMMETSLTYGFPLQSNWTYVNHQTPCPKSVLSTASCFGDALLRFDIKLLEIRCKEGFFPQGNCSTFTACSLTAPCVVFCSSSGRTVCNPDCRATAGPCVRKTSSQAVVPTGSAGMLSCKSSSTKRGNQHDKSSSTKQGNQHDKSKSSADHTLQLVIALGISLFLVCIAAVTICAFLRPRCCSDLTHGRRYLTLRNSFHSPSLKRLTSGCSDDEGSLSDVAAVHSHVIEACEEAESICEEPCFESAANGVSDVAFKNLPNGDDESIKTTSTSA